jgi:hypothetical protein
MSKVKKATIKKKATNGSRAHDVRPHRLHMLLSDSEAAMLDKIATKMGLTRSDAVRQIVRKYVA